MEDNTVRRLVTFQSYYVGIMAYIHAFEPSTRERLEFVGTLIHSIIDDLKLTESEKALYIEIYNRLIRKQIIARKTVSSHTTKRREQVLTMV